MLTAPLLLLSACVFGEDDTILLTRVASNVLDFDDDHQQQYRPGSGGFGGSSSGGFGSSSGASLNEAFDKPMRQYAGPGGGFGGGGFGGGSFGGSGGASLNEAFDKQLGQYAGPGGGMGGSGGSGGFFNEKARAGFVQFHAGAHVELTQKQKSNDGHNPWILHSKPFDSVGVQPPPVWNLALSQFAARSWGGAHDDDDKRKQGAADNGYAAPPDNGYAAPPDNGYAAPPDSGYAAPPDSDFVADSADLHEIAEAGEYSASAVFSALAIDLSRHGAPPGLIIGANQAAMDEIKHTHSMLALASHFSGKAPRRALYTPMAQKGSVLLTQNLNELSKTCYDTMRNEAGTITSLDYVRSKLLPGAPARHVLDEAIEDESRHVALFWSAMKWATDEGADVPSPPVLIEMDVSPSNLTQHQLALMQWAGLAQGNDWDKSANLVDRYWTTPWLAALQTGEAFPDVVVPTAVGELGASMVQMAKLVKGKVGHKQFADYTGWPGLRK